MLNIFLVKYIMSHCFIELSFFYAFVGSIRHPRWKYFPSMGSTSTILVVWSLLRGNYDQRCTVHPLNSVEPSIQYTFECEDERCLPCLHLNVHRTGRRNLETSIYCKTTHTDKYLTFNFYRPVCHRVLRRRFQSMLSIFFTICHIVLSNCFFLMHFQEVFPIHRGPFRKDIHYEYQGSVGSGKSGAKCRKAVTIRGPTLTFVTKTVSRPNDVFTLKEFSFLINCSASTVGKDK